ncbi:MAG: selenocysteine-specific translation elongation factor [Vicinamibacteria bacterium]|jgi:selenocysteine-specific elongation factor|nr:selenocysteine-specific translation elongation factor [Vicinamibacteria bacterium]
MRRVLIGTAGHIDHGKSALVTALTGTNPDRLKEEQERGITIDLGFAHFALDDETVVSFIDVPGHERFVRNMLAGAHGIDAVLLVVAADESVMPQTREHFHICRLLGIRDGAIALTKCDLADAEAQAVAEMETRELAAGSFLEQAEIVRVSARMGAGLDDLRLALGRLAARVASRDASGLLRIPVDRVFTVKGYGTIATGTVRGGTLSAGAEVEILPARRRARVRALQEHDAAVERVAAGQRAALNLAGVEVADLARGDVIARPDTLLPASLFDVEIALLPATRPLADQTRLRIHVGSAEILGRVRLIESDELAPGARGLAQLRLEAPATAGRGDNLILRAYSPAVTIGGARILDPAPSLKRRADTAARAQLAALTHADDGETARLMIHEAGPRGLALAHLAARITRPRAQVSEMLSRLDSVRLLAGDIAIAEEALAHLADKTLTVLDAFHAAQPLMTFMPREELRQRVFQDLPASVFDHVIAALADGRKIEAQPTGVARRGHTVVLNPLEEAACERLREACRAAGLIGVPTSQVTQASGSEARLGERALRVMLARGEIARIGDHLVLGQRLAELIAAIRQRLTTGSPLDVATVKEMTGLSRKYVIPLLEYLDSQKVTRRMGADRRIL